MQIEVLAIARHRNGICGAPFHVLIFDDGDCVKLAVLFEEKHHCAVFNLRRLARQDIRFGHNSYRGDHFEASLRQAAAEFDRKGE